MAREGGGEINLGVATVPTETPLVVTKKKAADSPSVLKGTLAEKKPTESPLVIKTESAEIVKAKESNTKVLEGYKAELTKVYGAKLAEAVTNQLIAFGYHGTGDYSLASIKDNEKSIAKQRNSSGLALRIATVAEIKSRDAAGTGADVNLTLSTLYKSMHGSAEEQAFPGCVKAREVIANLKKMSVEEIIEKNSGKDKTMSEYYKKWKDIKHSEPFTPEQIEEAIFDDMVNAYARTKEIGDLLVNVKQLETQATIEKRRATELPVQKPESAETLLKRASNSIALTEYQDQLTKQFDSGLAMEVADGLIILGFEGTDRQSRDNVTDIESKRSKIDFSGGLALGCVGEILVQDLDPTLYDDMATFNEKKKGLSIAEQGKLSQQILERNIALPYKVYKATRGAAEDLKDPQIRLAHERLEGLKSLTVKEIVDLASVRNPQVKIHYDEWVKDPKHSGEPFNPKTIEEDVYRDQVNTLILREIKSGKVKPIEQVESALNIDPKVKRSLTTTLASVYGDVGGERVNLKDEKYNAEVREAVEVGVERTAAIAQTEKQAKWGTKRKEGQSWISYAGEVVKNNIDRGWRTMFSDKLHQSKEARHGLRMMAQAGVETGLTAEFVSKVDAAARARIEESRKKLTTWGKVKANAKDFFSETFGKERELHDTKEQIIKEWRATFDLNPLQSKGSPIYDLVMSDMESRSEIARRVAESTQDVLHLSGESKSLAAIKVQSGSDYGKFLNENVFMVAAKDVLARKDAGETNIKGLSTKVRVEIDKKLNNYYQTPEFKKWKSTLSAAEQALLPDTFTYASDVIDQVEGSLIPNVIEMSDYYKTAGKLDIDINLTVGTAQYGPNGEISPEGVGRVKLRKEVMAKMHEMAGIVPAADVDKGIKLALFLAHADEWVDNPLVASIAGFIGGKMILTGAKAAAGAIGIGAVGGIKSGFREWAKLGEEINQVDIEKALGYTRIAEAKKYHKLEAYTNKSVIMGDHAASIETAIKKLSDSPVTESSITDLMSLIVNGEARVSLGIRHKINLIGAKSTGGSELKERQNYQLERRKFDHAQGLARVQIKQVADSNPEVWNKLRKDWGFADDASVDTILSTMRHAQEANLLDGSTIDTKYENALKSITIDQEKSIKGRAEAFSKFRLYSSLKHGAIVGATAGLITWGLAEASEFIHGSSPSMTTISETVVSPDLPHDPNGIPIGTLDGTEMHAYVPQGMHMIPMSTNVNGHTEYSLFVGDHKEALVDGIQAGHDGMPIITEATQAQLTANHLTITPAPLASHTIGDLFATPEVATHVQTEHMDIRFGDLPGSNEGGFWDWMMGSVRGHNTDVDINTQTNGAYKLFRLYENMRGSNNVEIKTEAAIPYDRVVHFKPTMWEGKEVQEFVVASNPTNMVVKDLPSLFATPEGHQKIANAVAEAVRMHDSGAPMDRFHDLLYQTSAGDKMLSAADGQYVFEQFGVFEPASTAAAIAETLPYVVTPHDLYIDISQSIVRDVACGLAPELVNGLAIGLPIIIDIHKPLEAAELNNPLRPTERYASTLATPATPVVTPAAPVTAAPAATEAEKDAQAKKAKELVESPVSKPKPKLELVPPKEKGEIKGNKEAWTFNYKGVEIKVNVGDIRDAKTDAIVSPTNATMTREAGAVENAIADAMKPKNYDTNIKKAKLYLSNIEGGSESAKKDYIYNTATNSTKVVQPAISAIDALNTSLHVWDDAEHHEKGDLRFGSSIAMPASGALVDKGVKTVVLTNVRPEDHIKNLTSLDIAHMAQAATRAANVVGATSITIPAIGTGAGRESGFGLSESESFDGFLAGVVNYIDTMQAVEVVPERDKKGNFIPEYDDDGKVRAFKSTTVPVDGHKPMTKIEFNIYGDPSEANIQKIKDMIDASETLKQIKNLKSSEKSKKRVVKSTNKKTPIASKKVDSKKTTTGKPAPAAKNSSTLSQNGGSGYGMPKNTYATNTPKITKAKVAAKKTSTGANTYSRMPSDRLK